MALTFLIDHQSAQGLRVRRTHDTLRAVDGLGLKKGNPYELVSLEDQGLGDGGLLPIRIKQIAAQIDELLTKDLSKTFTPSRIMPGIMDDLRQRAPRGQRAFRRGEIAQK